jgi:hypothetical protein
MSIILKNTSPYDGERMAVLLPFAFDDIDMAGVEVHVKGTKQLYRGRAYDGIPGLARVAPQSRFLVIVALSRVQKRLPERVHLGSKRLARGFPGGVPVAGWEDLFLYIAAHEARHIWQFRRRRATGRRGLREVDAEQFALARLDAWRRATGRAGLWG